MMALLKIARSLLNPENQDNYQDAAVYEVLAAALSGPEDADDGGAGWRPSEDTRG